VSIHVESDAIASPRLLGRRAISPHDSAPHGRKRKCEKKHRREKHAGCVDSPVSVRQAAGDDVGHVDCSVACKPRGDSKVNRIAALEISGAPAEARAQDRKGDADIAHKMSIEGAPCPALRPVVLNTTSGEQDTSASKDAQPDQSDSDEGKYAERDHCDIAHDFLIPCSP
jgi:hypothetical protein